MRFAVGTVSAATSHSGDQETKAKDERQCSEAHRRSAEEEVGSDQTSN